MVGIQKLVFLPLALLPAVLFSVYGYCPSPIYGSFSCTARIKTGEVSNAGTDDYVSIVLVGKNGQSSSKVYLDNWGNDFEWGSVGSYDITTSGVSPLDHIVIQIEGYNSWYLDWVEVSCPSAEISTHYDWQQWLHDRSVTLYGYSKVTCSSLSLRGMEDGTVSCSNSNNWGSRCQYHCNDGFLMRGSDCNYCNSNSVWSNGAADGTSCAEMCHWRRSHCYPGHCSGTTGQQLATTCTCQNGFTITHSNGARCDLATAPSLTTCHVDARDSWGTTTTSANSGALGLCQNQEDAFMNRLPSQVNVTMTAALGLTLTHNQSYVNEAKVGVTSLRVSLTEKMLSGTQRTIQSEQTLDGRPYCTLSADSYHPVTTGALQCATTLSITAGALSSLRDGDRVCADMRATAGGYYNVQDSSGRPQGTVTFTPTFSNIRSICFVYDITSPVHCSDPEVTWRHLACSLAPLSLSTRLTRSPAVRVTVDGWVDPRPNGGENVDNSASGVAWYRLTVHNMLPHNGSLQMEASPIEALTRVWNVTSYSYPLGAGESSVTVLLPQMNKAQLYGLILEVHDKAGNVRNARRLVLLDNSSYVGSNYLNPITATQVISRSNQLWKTDLSQSVCVNWTNHFYNTEASTYALLLPVTPASDLRITGNYEQTTGDLPVSGTKNDKGITKFEVAWSVNGLQKSNYTEIADVNRQTTCLNHSLHDGETYDVYIKASDIMQNSKEDSVRVSIDSSGPVVSVSLYGQRDDGVYVLHANDLSDVTLQLMAKDPHSGLDNIHWALGTYSRARDVAEMGVAVQKLQSMAECHELNDCYCPRVGSCENSLYFISLSHNSSGLLPHDMVYLTISITNGAGLVMNVDLRILLEKPPTAPTTTSRPHTHSTTAPTEVVTCEDVYQDDCATDYAGRCGESLVQQLCFAFCNRALCNPPTQTSTTGAVSATTALKSCPPFDCSLDCGLSGYALDAQGCMQCQCDT